MGMHGEGEAVGALAQRVAHHILHIRLRVVHVSGEVGERHLRLDHPKLGQVARCVRRLGTEGRAEGVHVAERACVALGGELARDGQVRRAPKEVVGRVGVVRRQSCHLEHLARALAIGSGDQRRVHVGEALVAEEGVGRVREGRTDARHRADRVCSWAQVRDPAQELERVPLLLEWVRRRWALADQLDVGRLELDGLLARGRRDDVAVYRHRRAGRQRVGHAVAVERRVRDHLDTSERCAVVHLDEGEGLLPADGAHPARDADVLPDQLVARPKKLAHAHARGLRALRRCRSSRGRQGRARTWRGAAVP